MKNYLVYWYRKGEGKGVLSPIPFPPHTSPPPPHSCQRKRGSFHSNEKIRKKPSLPDCRTCWGRRVYTCLVAVHFTFVSQSFQESFFREIKLRTVSQKIWAFYPLNYNIKPKQWRCQIDSVHEKLLPKLQNNLFLFFKTCSKF